MPLDGDVSAQYRNANDIAKLDALCFALAQVDVGTRWQVNRIGARPGIAASKQRRYRLP